MDNQNEGLKKQRLVVEVNPNYKKFYELVSEFKFLDEFENQLSTTFKELLQLKTQNNFYIENNEDLVERVTENIFQKQLGFHKKNVISAYLTENIKMDFAQKDQPHIEENDQKEQNFENLPENFDQLDESQKQ